MDFLPVIIAIASLIAGIAFGYLLRKMITRKELQSSENLAVRIKKDTAQVNRWARGVNLPRPRTIRQIAEEGPCVIIGRCASAILRAAGYRPLSVFIYADSADRAKRIAARNNLDEKRALHKAQKVDRMRKHHFDFYADTLWGEPESYDLMLSSSEYGVSGAASVIASAKEAMQHE